MAKKTDESWKAEREVSGAWVVARTLQFGSSSVRELHGRSWKGETLPTYFNTLEQAQARATELNQGVRR